MRRGPTFWIVMVSALAAGGGLYVDHRRANPPPPDGVTVSDVGDLAPEAAYVAIDGKPMPLSAWRGRRVLINFWATWCAPCRREMPLLSHASASQAPGGLVVLGVAEDTADAVRAYLATQPVSYPVLLVNGDAPGSSLSFGNTQRVLPYSILIGKDGRILRKKRGPFTPAELDTWLTP